MSANWLISISVHAMSPVDEMSKHSLVELSFPLLKQFFLGDVSIALEDCHIQVTGMIILGLIFRAVASMRQTEALALVKIKF